ncbi:hypothetical protein E3Q24_02988 [Wallemia mellicola]|nr:hypothetical protein E3Q24_02988 [Wallemia mellicola]
MKEIRCVLCGDQGVGKSTIITNLIKNQFIESIQPCLPEVVIELDYNLHIIDTNEDNLLREIKKSNVICLVYSISDSQTHSNIREWLSYFKSNGINNPIILIGNKLDFPNPDYSFDTDIIPIMKEFKEIETCVEASAKTKTNINEIFYFAQRAVLHPTAPLYDSRQHTLKPASASALSRIFRLCDTNKDNLLDSTELNRFQLKCFGTPLKQSELDAIMELVSQHSNQTVSKVSNGTLALTELGFILLHTIFIQRGRLETTWTVLRKFGYAQDLRLKEEFLYPKFDVNADSSVELSPDGYSFFTEIFEKFDIDKDGALSENELSDLFLTSPGNPWMNKGFPDTTLTDEKGAVTLQGWLAQWSMTTLLDHKTTLAYLAYLGYEPSSNAPVQDSTSALKTTPPRRRRKGEVGKVQRNVFLAYVLGAPGSGKTSLLRSLLNKQFNGTHTSTNGVLSVVNSVEVEGGAEKYLVCQEFEATTLKNSKKLQLADVIVLVYDCSDANSFSYLSNLHQNYNLDGIPCVYVATKSDLDLAQQRHEVQPDVYCRRLNLPVPIAVSIKTNQTAGIFQTLCSVASNPRQALPLSGRSSSRSMLHLLSLTLTVGGGLVGIAAILTKYNWRPWSMYMHNVYRGMLAWWNNK